MPLGVYSQHFIFFVAYKWAKCFRMLHTLGCKGLTTTNTLAYLAIRKLRRKKVCGKGPRVSIHNTSFSLLLKNRHHNIVFCPCQVFSAQWNVSPC